LHGQGKALSSFAAAGECRAPGAIGDAYESMNTIQRCAIFSHLGAQVAPAVIDGAQLLERVQVSRKTLFVVDSPTRCATRLRRRA
jgi:hypothetical protein